MRNSASKTMLDIDACVLTHVGNVRTNNEDSVRLVRPNGEEVLASHGVLTVLADGMGGHEGGELASSLAVEALARAYYHADAAPGDALEQALREASLEIYAASREDAALRGMGTTCVAAAICEDQLWWAWVGDSRLYLLRGGQIYRLSEDHTVVHEMVQRGLLTDEEAFEHPDRSVLSRALGSRAEVEPSAADYPIQLNPGDRLLLCSDGLHDLMTDAEMASLAVEPEVQVGAKALLQAALDRGGFDNVSLALLEVCIRTPGARPPVITREFAIQ